MRKYASICSKILIFFFLYLYQPIIADSTLPQGRWYYSVTGDTLAGNLTVSRYQSNGVITTTSAMNLKTASTIILSDETIRETMAYNPIQYLSKTTVTHNNTISRTDIAAKITKDYIIVSENNNDTHLKLKSDIIFGTNKFLERALNSNFKNETFSYMLYDPSVNTRKIIRLYANVTPTVPVTINGTEKQLNHLIFFIKSNTGHDKNIMEIFCDATGIIHLFKFDIDNTSIEFILKI